MRIQWSSCTEVAKRTAERVAEAGGKVVVAPCLHVGLAEHHMPFGGTLTLDVASYKAVLKGLTGSMVREGFKRILLLNGHGGNETALKNISQELSTELDATIATASYWTIPSVAVAYGSILTAQAKVMHAGNSSEQQPFAVRRMRFAGLLLYDSGRRLGVTFA